MPPDQNDVGTSAAERDPLKETLATFRELGGTLIDTAPSYGNAETVVGDLVADLGFRDDLFIATKVRKEGRDEGLAEIAVTQRNFAAKNPIALFYGQPITLEDYYN